MRRHALVVGVGRYDDAAIIPPQFAMEDATLVADRLACRGFQTRLLVHPTRQRFEKTLDEAVAALSARDVFLIFYTGRWVASRDGAHRLLLRDDRLSIPDGAVAGIRLDTALAPAIRIGIRMAVLLDSTWMDAEVAIDPPLPSAWARQKVQGSFCLVLPCAGPLPPEGSGQLGHGLFAKAVADAVDEDDSSLGIGMKAFSETLARRVSILAEANSMRHAPRSAFAKIGLDFPLISKEEDAGTASKAVPASEPPPLPESRPAASPPQPPPPPPPQQARRSEEIPVGREPGECREFLIAEGVAMKFRWCPATTSDGWKKMSGGADTFAMGSPTEEPGRNAADEFRHNVRLTKGFWIGETPVLQAQWEMVMGRAENRSPEPKGGEKPVTCVAWEDAMAFLVKVNAFGIAANLPTEAQWEYACRAGSSGGFGPLKGPWWSKEQRGQFASDGLALLFRGMVFDVTYPVCQCRPNRWGVHDMHGNCGEWCLDWFGPYPSAEVADPTGPANGDEHVGHVVRGMKEMRTQARCRSASRWHAPARKLFGWRRYRHPLIGLRLVVNPGEGIGR